ncbi:inositol monophosphatase family protein [Salipiger mucosus]|uniref:Inositol monophosphatase family protein n=1 Tax=Salipiger mucosus DSM 16094 TaxID=1123237 RepID=S9S752_9RHOB|nr:inositol monophosphatase family protein [Salipiger mucosus]EPX86020.1 Inositol monophosphatase family protein [Salipiger mucosus DSM 16094]
MLNLAEALDFANRSADGAGKLALDHFRRPLSVEHKADDSPVTVVDRGIETFLREQIATAYPDHGIFGEEHGVENLDRDHVWVVDPIDGTKSFVTGHPLFGGLMELLERGEPCLGQIDMPATGERWCGITGAPTTLNGAPVRTSACRALADAYAYTTDPMLFAGPRRAVFDMLRGKTRLLRYGGDCYNYALLASGHCDLVLETGLEPYDFLPVVQVVRGAGGVITDWQGEPLGTGSGGDVLASATAELHAQMLDELARLRADEAA